MLSRIGLTIFHVEDFNGIDISADSTSGTFPEYTFGSKITDLLSLVLIDKEKIDG